MANELFVLTVHSLSSIHRLVFLILELYDVNLKLSYSFAISNTFSGLISTSHPFAAQFGLATSHKEGQMLCPRISISRECKREGTAGISDQNLIFPLGRPLNPT